MSKPQNQEVEFTRLQTQSERIGKLIFLLVAIVVSGLIWFYLSGSLRAAFATFSREDDWVDDGWHLTWRRTAVPVEE